MLSSLLKRPSAYFLRPIHWAITLVMLVGWMTASAITPPEMQALFERHVLRLDRALELQRLQTAATYGEALDLAEEIYRQTRNVGGLSAVNQQRVSWKPGEQALPPDPPEANNAAELAEFYSELKDQWDRLQYDNRLEHAYYHQVYRNWLAESAGDSSLPASVRESLWKQLQEVPSLSASSILNEQLLASLQPMEQDGGVWKNCDWPDALEIEHLDDGIRFHLSHDFKQHILKVRQKSPLSDTQVAAMRLSGFRTVELVDINEPDLAVYWLMRGESGVVDLDIEYTGERIWFNRKGDSRPVLLREFRKMPGKNYAEPMVGGRTRFGVRQWFPAVTLQRGKDCFLYQWSTR